MVPVGQELGKGTAGQLRFRVPPKLQWESDWSWNNRGGGEDGAGAAGDRPDISLSMQS